MFNHCSINISNYKISHDDNRIFISFDHMFAKDKFTIFMLSLKIDKQGFPIYFKAFDGKFSANHGEAFEFKNIKSSLLYVHNLFKSIISDVHIVFLADRWFGNYFPLF